MANAAAMHSLSAAVQLRTAALVTTERHGAPVDHFTLLVDACITPTVTQLHGRKSILMWPGSDLFRKPKVQLGKAPRSSRAGEVLTP
jgi:hypothetical protein